MGSSAFRPPELRENWAFRGRPLGGVDVTVRYRQGTGFVTGRDCCTSSEADRIREHANRLEPVDPSDANQLRLFDHV